MTAILTSRSRISALPAYIADDIERDCTELSLLTSQENGSGNVKDFDTLIAQREKTEKIDSVAAIVPISMNMPVTTEKLDSIKKACTTFTKNLRSQSPSGTIDTVAKSLSENIILISLAGAYDKAKEGAFKAEVLIPCSNILLQYTGSKDYSQ